ncbi:phage major tail protein, phi13 family [Pilibacter termitis]|uniref:Phage major tail protein, phi13 family n=1 Tax=Pilibacter termitis TaxID=263852 RepID=A0A1T4PED5_9ENTE|nr:major tail protein [Pilibacter termitis]SJZ89839.1 phage major tail protein, phi13 family [Pilibacter termitis]
METVGFKKLIIKGLDNVTEHYWEVQGTQDEGASISATISGMSKEPKKVFGSDVAYYVSRKGTGDIKVEFQAIDLPNDCVEFVSGYEKGSDGLTYVGNTTEPPYVSIALESVDLHGKFAGLVFLKGTISRDAIEMKTQTEETFTPEGVKYTFTAVESDVVGATQGKVFAQYIGDDAQKISALRALIAQPTTSTSPTL